MNALGGKRVSKSTREKLEYNALQLYKKVEKEQEENNVKRYQMWYFLIAMITLEQEFGFGEKRRIQFQKAFRDNAIELSKMMTDNTCEYKGRYTDFDYVGNQEKLKRLCKQYNVQYEENLYNEDNV